jgi:hypothetical protein
MKGKVVKFNANPDIVATLEMLLEDAQQGRLDRGFVYAGLQSDGNIPLGYAGDLDAGEIQSLISEQQVQQTIRLLEINGRLLD